MMCVAKEVHRASKSRVCLHCIKEPQPNNRAMSIRQTAERKSVLLHFLIKSLLF